MNSHRILCKCECGNYVQPFSLRVTDQKSLMVIGKCIACESLVNVFFPLDYLEESCPAPAPTLLIEEGKPMPGKPFHFTVEDVRMLRSGKIDPEEEGEG